MLAVIGAGRKRQHSLPPHAQRILIDAGYPMPKEPRVILTGECTYPYAGTLDAIARRERIQDIGEAFLIVGEQADSLIEMFIKQCPYPLPQIVRIR